MFTVEAPLTVRQDHDDDDLFKNSSFSKIVKMTQQWSSLPKKIHLLFNLWIHLQVNAQESRDGQILFEVKIYLQKVCITVSRVVSS